VAVINYPGDVGGLAHGVYHKCFTAYRNVKETVPGSQLSYHASDVMWSGGQSIPEQKRERGRQTLP